MKIALIACCIGLVSGVIAALCGVGGGILMVPAFVLLLGMPQKVAVATSLAIIIPTAIAATVVNFRNGLVDKQVFLWTALGAVFTATFMATKLKTMSDDTLTKFFAIFIIAMGVKLWFTETPGKKDVAPAAASGTHSANNTPD
jgi:uncharacterized protein